MTALDEDLDDDAAAALTTTMDEAKNGSGDHHDEDDDDVEIGTTDSALALCPKHQQQKQQQQQKQPRQPPRPSDRKKAAAEIARLDGDDGIRLLLESHAAAEPASPEEKQQKLDGSRGCWDRFFERNKTAFYKDKHHLRGEFGEMMPEEVRQDPKRWRPPLARLHADLSRYPFPVDKPPPPSVWENKTCFLELGCGVGNAAFPLLRANPDLFGWCVDFSQASVETLRGRDEYDPERLYAFQADITNAEQLYRHIPESLVGQFRFVTAVWVLSAIDPSGQLPHVVRHVLDLLAPGGVLLVRDYAVGDLSQLRLNPANCKLGDNFYVCGDGTLRSFLDPEGARHVFESAGFETIELRIIRRNIVNHKEGVEMRRFWIQGKFRKRLAGAAGDGGCGG